MYSLPITEVNNNIQTMVVIITVEMLQENQQNVECATVQESAGCAQAGEKNDILVIMEFQEA